MSQKEINKQRFKSEINYQRYIVREHRNEPVSRTYYVDEHDRARLLNLANAELNMAERHFEKALNFIEEYEDKIRK